MQQTLQEFCDSRGLAVRADRQAGVIRGVKILGLASRNGRVYRPEALADAAVLYEDAKVNVNHPKGDLAAGRDYQDRLGAIRGVVFRPGEGLFADLHFNPKHALAEQLLWDAQHAPENVGFSHNVLARTARRNDQVVVESILRVESVDLVADPATTRGLFESHGAHAACEGPAPESEVRLAEATLDQLRRRRPDLLEQLERDQTQQLSSLREQVERLTSAQFLAEKRQTIRRLLRESGLPERDSDKPSDRAIVSERFVASLLAAADERAIRELVEERAQLVRALGGHDRPGLHQDRRPLARDQYFFDADPPDAARQFAAAITG